MLLGVATFGVLSPAESLSEALHKSTHLGKCTRHSFALLYVLVLYLFPVIGMYAIIPEDGSLEETKKASIAVLVTYYVLLLIPTVATVVVVMKDRESRMIQGGKPEYVRMNWQNMNVWLELMFEFIQLIFFALIASEAKTGAGRAVTRDGFNYVGFWQGAHVDYFNVIFWIVFSMVVLFFVLSAAPVVMEDILGAREEGSIRSAAVYRFGISFLSMTLFMLITTKLSQALACEEEDGELVLTIQDSIVCYSDRHRERALIALMCLSFFVPTGFLSGSRSLVGTKKEKEALVGLDIRFSTFTRLFMNVMKGVIAVMHVFVSNEQPMLFLSFYIVIIGVLFWFVTYGDRYESFEICNIRSGLSVSLSRSICPILFLMPSMLMLVSLFNARV
jgi:hypothetical protein